MVVFSFVYSFLLVVTGIYTGKFQGYSVFSLFWKLPVYVPFILPYIIFQIMITAVFARDISLKKLFFLSLVFAAIGHFISNMDLYQYGFIRQWDYIIFKALRLFFYTIPVFILMFMRPGKSTIHPASELDNDKKPKNHGTDIANNGTDTNINKKPWYKFDKSLLIFIIIYGIIIYSGFLLSYLSGLYNSMFILFLLFFLLLPLYPLFLIPLHLLAIPIYVCILLLVIRIFIVWPKYISDKRKFVFISVVMVIVSGFLIYLPSSHGKDHRNDIQFRGFRNYVEAEVDVRAIRSWLDILKPDDCVELENIVLRNKEDKYTTPKRLEYKQSPFAIKKLRPKYALLSLDADNNPMVRIYWGSGVAGTWGFVVGKENMSISDSAPFWSIASRGERRPVLKSEYRDEHEYRESICDGVYIFQGLD
jgi:hypothetical protein